MGKDNLQMKIGMLDKLKSIFNPSADKEQETFDNLEGFTVGRDGKIIPKPKPKPKEEEKKEE